MILQNFSVQYQHQSISSYELLKLLEASPANFLFRLVIGEEIWVHHWIPRSKLESRQLKHWTSPTIKNLRIQYLASKIMVSIFWDVRWILLIDYLPRKATIADDYNTNLI